MGQRSTRCIHALPSKQKSTTHNQRPLKRPKLESSPVEPKLPPNKSWSRFSPRGCNDQCPIQIHVFSNQKSIYEDIQTINQIETPIRNPTNESITVF